MSRDAMLEEAIAKAKERKEWQLVEWLRSARGATASARYYTGCIADLNAENAKLRELVRDMFYAVHPADREKFLTNVVELGVEVDG